MKLKAVTVNKQDPAKIDFAIEKTNGQVITMTLREQADWPVILGQPLNQVEEWLVARYQVICALACLADK